MRSQFSHSAMDLVFVDTDLQEEEEEEDDLMDIPCVEVSYEDFQDEIYMHLIKISLKPNVEKYIISICKLVKANPFDVQVIRFQYASAGHSTLIFKILHQWLLTMRHHPRHYLLNVVEQLYKLFDDPVAMDVDDID